SGFGEPSTRPPPISADGVARSIGFEAGSPGRSSKSSGSDSDREVALAKINDVRLPRSESDPMLQARSGVHPKSETGVNRDSFSGEELMKKARVIPREVKLAALLRMEAGENVAALARELKVRRKLLYDWRARFRAGGAEALVTRGHRLKAMPELTSAQADEF